MEQTVTIERTVEDPAIEFETPDQEFDANEVYVEPWGNELFALVNLNQGVMVTCPWMDGAEVTLGTAMTAYEYPPNLTAEDEPFLVSVVNGLLASRVIEAKEPEDPVDEVETETEVEIDEEPAADKSETKLQEDEVTPPKEPQQRVVGNKVFKEPVASPAVNKKQRPAQPVVEIRQPEKASVGTEETLQPEAVVEIINSKSDASVSTEQTHQGKTAVLEGEGAVDLGEDAAEQPADFLAAIKAVAPEFATTPERPIVAELEITQAGLDDEISDFPLQPLPVESLAEAEPVVQAPEIERLTALAKGAALLGDELVDVSEDKPVSASTNSHLDGNETESLGEEDVETGQIIMPDLEVIDDTVDAEERFTVGKDDELELGVEAEPVTAIPQAEVDIVAEQILAEYVERDTPQTTELANHYLDKIIEAAVEVRAVDGGEVIEETEISEELEDLFIELLDEMGVAHTPELIENLVSQTVERRIAKNKELEDEEKDEDTQQGGLSTKLKKSSVGRATLNDAIVHDRLISKIALELCGFKVSFSLN